jgi:Flp pilus assembly protein TadG
MSGFYKDYDDSDQTYLDTAEQAANAAISAQQQTQAILDEIQDIVPSLTNALALKANTTDVDYSLELKLSKTETINGGSY